AMPSSRAARLCPDAIFLRPRFDAYREVSRQINNVFRQYTSLIEPLSLDEAFLDVTQYAARHGSATEAAMQIKSQIKQELDLTASAGVSYNKFLAKIASDMEKPDGLYVIRPEAAEQFIEQLEIRKFFGVGRVTEQKMHALGIYRGADLKRLSKIQLQTHFGQSGGYYYNIARGIDERPVKAHRQRKSIGSETTFASNTRSKKQIWETLRRLAMSVATALEKKKLVARTVTLKVRYADFKLITRSKTRRQPAQSLAEILLVLPELLKKTEVGTRPIRLIGITLASLQPETPLPEAQSLPGEVRESRQLGLF
ncbi:MAG: DNA polymerase IV, partial [Gammaproteobacteria bacterium]|nr:DNA polymerase IV [Gammaproteobacteria bacterium]